MMKQTKIESFNCQVKTRHYPTDIPLIQHQEYERGDDAYLSAKRRLIVENTPKKTADNNSTKDKFYVLYNKWFEETAHLSLIKQQTSDMSFLKIIGMGETALPYIFKELKKIPMISLMIALEAIISVDVAEKATSHKEAVNMWLAWGKKKNLIK